MPSLAPSPDQLARFRRDLAALGGSGRLGIAVSGGPDSLALLLLAAAALPGEVEAATVDHGLRRASAVEALHVEDICARIGCPHNILEAEVPDGPAGLQGEARGARYAALAGWAGRHGLSRLATAHHADDQAETMLMRLRRGSGIAGLSGIRPVRSEGDLLIVRPLLGWTKAELVHLVATAGIEAADDPSNRDTRFDRAAVRRLLADHPQFEPHRLARSAAACREADEALAWSAAELAEDRITSQGGEWRVDPSGLPRELRRRLLARAVAEVRAANGLEPPWTGGEDVEGLLAALEAGGTSTLAGVVGRGGGPAWQLRAAPPRRSG
jgi:tRNA(Ile)-lysidine synthase